MCRGSEDVSYYKEAIECQSAATQLLYTVLLIHILFAYI